MTKPELTSTDLPSAEALTSVADTEMSFLDRLPGRKTVACALAATSLLGAARASAGIESYNNRTPKGAALEYLDLFSKGKIAEACRLDHYHCPGGKKNDTLSPRIKQLYKRLYTPISAEVLPDNPYDSETLPQARGGTLVQVRTPIYAQNNRYACEVVKKFGSEWEIVLSTWSGPNAPCDKLVVE